MIGFLELIGNWLVILGLLTPLGTLALPAHPRGWTEYSRAGNGVDPHGRKPCPALQRPESLFFRCRHGGSELISGLDQGGAGPETDQPGGFGALTTATNSVKVFRQAD